MQSTEFENRLRDAITAGQLVRVTRATHDGDCHTSGIPLALSTSLLLLHHFEGSMKEFDGFHCVRIGDISALRSNEYERFDERIIAGECMLTGPRGARPPVESWADLFRHLKRGGELVILECEHNDPTEFDLGEILQVNRASVIIHDVDATGVWSRSPIRQPYDEITCVQFGSRYIRMFDRYSEARPEMVRERRPRPAAKKSTTRLARNPRSR